VRFLKNPLSKRASEDKRQTDLLLEAWEESGKVYGYRKLHDDLLDQGEVCCPNRVARLTRLAGIKAQIGYKRRPGIYGGRPAVAIDNTLDRQFDVAAPDKAWVNDITYIRTCEGFAYLAVIIDLKHARTCSITSRCSTTPNASTSGTECCRPSSSKSSRKSNPRESTKLGAIQLHKLAMRRSDS
jgi:transposase InsO family protein